MKETHSVVENDLVLIHINHNPAFFARVEEIKADQKPGWWQVRFLPLGLENLDFNTIVWILDDQQIRGEAFTMQSVPMRVEWIEPYGHRTSVPKRGNTKQHSGKRIALVKKQEIQLKD